ISVKNNFERRIGIWPAGFDKDGLMYCNTAFGDYPQYLPSGPADHLKSRFTGWMLLNYGKPVMVSSTLGGQVPNYAVDESIRTWWSAKTGDPGEYLISDLGSVSEVHAIQINYADQDASIMGKVPHLYHQYKLWGSNDGKVWRILADKSKNSKDVPHDYLTFDQPVHVRYVKLENLHVPSGKFAISGLRVFGLADCPKPLVVKDLIVLRTEKDKRSAWIKWSPSDDAYGYNLYFGTAPDKLYNSIMVYGSNEYWFKGMDKESDYYFAIEAFNEAGVSQLSEIKHIQ
ncbi:MAG: discoidin domain-containing protein, partial [Marinilabiliales bacterium]|nr:discoidin domain-containing protein [Marinilabiliales bacterium]